MPRNKESREEKMSALQEKLVDGVKEIYESGKWAEFIAVMSKFPNYSINNCILIASQCPGASFVCGYKKWNEFNRNVMKGESGIMIFAPIKSKIKVEEPLYDSDHHPVLNEDGTQAKEQVEREFKSFRPCYVFDVSQTEGEPLPSLANQLNDSVEDYEHIKEALLSISPVPISFEDIAGNANGYYSPDAGKIVVQKDMGQLQTIKTMLHEISHATYGHGSKDDKTDKETKEVQAESTAFWVAGMLGLDTSDYSFGYIAGWSKDKEVSELKDNLELIKKTADKITSDIDSYMKEVFKHEQKSTDIDSDVEVYFTVAECSEFHSMAGYTEKIESAEEAKGIFESIPKEMYSYIPAIGIQLIDKKTGEEITQCDVINRGVANYDMLQYYSEIIENPKAMKMLGKLAELFPDIEVVGEAPALDIAEPCLAVRKKTR